MGDTLDLTGLVEKESYRGTVYYETVEGSVVAKQCTKCKELLPLADFYRQKSGIGGVTPKCGECEKEYKRDNKDTYRSIKKSWKDKNPNYYKEYYQKNKNKYNKYSSRRKEALRNLDNTLSNGQLNAISMYFNKGCALTGESEFHWDHAIPISTGKGGTNFGNMYPLRGDLNISKKDKNIFEWFKANRQRFNLSQAKFDALIDWLAETNDMTVEEYTAYVYECHGENLKEAK